MSGGVLYANASIIMQGDTYLLTRKRIRDLAAASNREDLLKVLAECNYQTNLPTDEAIIEAERAQTLRTFNDLCEDDALKTCVTTLANATETNYASAFQTIADTLPHIKSKSIREYFITLADLTNVRIFYKGGHNWVAGGKLGPDELNLFPEQTDDQIEAAITQRLDELAAVDQDDIFKPNPLFWWYHQKQKELTAVKIILMGKRFNYDAATIRANLGGLYEQFK